ncbi:MAG: DNA polymerase III subunit epsilon [Rhodospirillaceae bacterium]
MRQIILDTETTGLDPNLGHRIIEIAGVELVNRRLTGNHFHRYINPERDSEDAALQVHGLTTEFLKDKPKFKEIATELLDYISGAELVIHNAPFDIAFLNAEFARLKLKPVTDYCAAVLDTLRLAKEIHPGKRNSLDALCDRYQIDNSARTLHGALLDAQLLAEVYLSMTRGQESLVMEVETVQLDISVVEIERSEVSLFVLKATDEELAAHQAQVEELQKASGGKCLWIASEQASAAA